MLSPARPNTSKSLLREPKNALILLDDEVVRGQFLNKISSVVSNVAERVVDRQGHKKTGAKDTKSELLAYLNTFGNLRTANIWARNLPLEKSTLNALLAQIQATLLENKLQGIVEIHLQDREINSSHIQFVGIKADVAEVLIGKILVDLGYESSLESALGKKNYLEFEPYFIKNKEARAQKLEPMLEYVKNLQDSREAEALESVETSVAALKNYLAQIKSKRENLIKKAHSIVDSISDSTPDSTRIAGAESAASSGISRARFLQRRLHSRLPKSYALTLEKYHLKRMRKKRR